MSINQRIQGRLRELLEAVEETRGKDLQREFNLVTEALQYAKGTKNAYEIAYASIFYGHCELERSHIDEAFKIFAEVKEYSERTGEFQILSSAYFGMGTCYSNKQNHNLAEEMFLLSLRLSEQHSFISLNPLLSNVLASTYLNQGRFDEAIDIAYRLQDIIEIQNRMFSMVIFWMLLIPD